MIRESYWPMGRPSDSQNLPNPVQRDVVRQLRREADQQLFLGRAVIAERLEHRAAELEVERS